jgi:hypothetical protein
MDSGARKVRKQGHDSRFLCYARSAVRTISGRLTEREHWRGYINGQMLWWGTTMNKLTISHRVVYMPHFCTTSRASPMYTPWKLAYHIHNVSWRPKVVRLIWRYLWLYISSERSVHCFRTFLMSTLLLLVYIIEWACRCIHHFLPSSTATWCMHYMMVACVCPRLTLVSHLGYWHATPFGCRGRGSFVEIRHYQHRFESR